MELSAGLTDRRKMIAEYWLDGPKSEQPPGHWTLFAQWVSARDHHTLDDDVKMFFALSNAMFDAGIAAWDMKRAYDSVRPATAIPALLAGKKIRAWGGREKGQSRLMDHSGFLTNPRRFRLHRSRTMFRDTARTALRPPESLCLGPGVTALAIRSHSQQEVPGSNQASPPEGKWY